MKNSRNVKILAVVGMSGSGKSVAVEYLTEKGVPKVYFGGMIYKEMEKRGIERTSDGESEKDFREMIRKTEGKDWVVRQAIKETNDLISAGQKRVVLDGVYSWTEYKILKQEFPRELVFVAVVAPKRLRYERVGEREFRPLSQEEIRKRDYAEIEGIEKGGPIAMADYFILNDEGVEKMYENLEKILKKEDFWE